MAGQQVVKASSEKENSTAFIEKKLQESLVHIYDATRIANDIKTLDTKLQSLLAIKNQLSKDSNNSSAHGLVNMNRTIEELQKDMEKKKTEMHTAEKHVIKGFLDILQFLMDKSTAEVESARQFMGDTVKSFGGAMSSSFESKVNDIILRLDNVEKFKMDRSEKADIQKTIDAFKTHILQLHKTQLDSLKNVAEKQYSIITSQLGKRLEGVDPDTLTTKVQQRIMENMDAKFKQHLQQVEETNKANVAPENNEKISEKITQSVKEEVKAHITPDALKSIISTLPEYQALQSFRSEQSPLSDAVKKLITDLQKEFSDLKIQSHSTRAIINNLVNKNVSPTDREAINAHYITAIKHVDEMHKSIQLIHNNMKMMETVMSVQLRKMEELTASNATPAISRKRPRTDDDLDMAGQGSEMSNQYVLGRVAELEAKHQKLLDYILQCKDTVLDENYPDRIGAAFKKIEDTLLNQQTFIAFLVDPFTTGKTIKSRESVSIPTTETSTVLHPAMLDAISLLVKQTAEEISLPLKERIKALEEQLNAKQ